MDLVHPRHLLQNLMVDLEKRSLFEFVGNRFIEYQFFNCNSFQHADDLISDQNETIHFQISF